MDGTLSRVDLGSSVRYQFKEGVMPKVYAAVQAAKLRVGKSDWGRAADADGKERKCGVVSWADGRETAYELGEGVDFRVVSYFCRAARRPRLDALTGRRARRARHRRSRHFSGKVYVPGPTSSVRQSYLTKAVVPSGTVNVQRSSPFSS